MSTEVEPSDWACLDPWWSVYAEAQPIGRRSASTKVFDLKRLADCWHELDPLWQSYTGSSPVVQCSASVEDFPRQRLTDCWDELDPWWDVYGEVGHSTAIEIGELLDHSNEEWRRSDGPFDTDPLAADLTLNRSRRGPLQPNNEVGWSRWLARVLAPSGALVSEVVDVEVSGPPGEILLENQLSKEGGFFRRPDILVHYADRGVSIEVKLGDEHYEKTAETARLIERHYDDQEWTHTLLLPKSQVGRLRSIVEPSVEPRSDGRLQIEWGAPGPVSLVYWNDVTAAIRSLLLRGAAVDDHWAANAYLFCAVAEQRLMDFQPQPAIKRMAAPSNVVDSTQPIQLSDTLEEQLTYLRAVVEP